MGRERERVGGGSLRRGVRGEEGGRREAGRWRTPLPRRRVARIRDPPMAQPVSQRPFQDDAPLPG
jgi:hypothetical protein